MRNFSYDLDVGFSDFAFGAIPVIDGWNAAFPLPFQPMPLLEKILQEPTIRARYQQVAIEILEKHFRPEELGAQLDTLFAQIQDDLLLDPFPDVRATNPEDTDFSSIIPSLKAFMQLRYDRARTELGL